MKHVLQFHVTMGPSLDQLKMKQLDVEMSTAANVLYFNLGTLIFILVLHEGTIYLLKYELFSSLNFGPVTQGRISLRTCTDGWTENDPYEPIVHKHKCAQKPKLLKGKKLFFSTPSLLHLYMSVTPGHY